MDVIEKLIKSLQEAKTELESMSKAEGFSFKVHKDPKYTNHKQTTYEVHHDGKHVGHLQHDHKTGGIEGGVTPHKLANAASRDAHGTGAKLHPSTEKNIGNFHAAATAALKNHLGLKKNEDMEKAEMEEPHKDDPNHEKKEKKAAKKIKDEAEDILDMHKMEELTCSANGQWSLKKDAANPALAPKAKKVKMLQQQIDAGTYKPDAGKIAGAMIEHSKKK